MLGHVVEEELPAERTRLRPRRLPTLLNQPDEPANEEEHDVTSCQSAGLGDAVVVTCRVVGGTTGLVQLWQVVGSGCSAFLARFFSVASWRGIGSPSVRVSIL
jgi:hypothetical protein